MENLSQSHDGSSLKLAAGKGHGLDPAPLTNRVRVGDARNRTGAKFIRP